METKQPKRLFTVDEAANYLGLSPRTIYNGIHPTASVLSEMVFCLSISFYPFLSALVKIKMNITRFQPDHKLVINSYLD